MPYFFQKSEKMSQNLSSATVVIGALRVNNFHYPTLSELDGLCLGLLLTRPIMLG